MIRNGLGVLLFGFILKKPGNVNDPHYETKQEHTLNKFFIALLEV